MFIVRLRHMLSDSFADLGIPCISVLTTLFPSFSPTRLYIVGSKNIGTPWLLDKLEIPTCDTYCAIYINVPMEPTKNM